ncbi:MAG: undecaprenyl diphosphate synthase family protein, partial [Methanotrichaceae archaeon]|nr:undecaprenyl diphosphate synthase family protein [Methanotrichaceae archaeon]
AFRKLLKDVENGRLNPEDIDEKSIEKNLRFGEKPDLVIRAGGKHLSDFMIWQAAYSELYFTEIRWSSLRKIDFLRAIRDCRNRKRRFGR